MEKITWSNGLRLLLLPVEGALSASVGVWIEAGSRYEPAAAQGISHFVEHMLFKGTAARSARDISEEMDMLGGSLNAYTTQECTRYYAQTLAQNAPGALELLSDMLLHSRMAPADVELERKVILDEIAMYEDVGEDLAHEALCAAAWPGSPLGRPICGTRSSVAALTSADLLRYVREQYTPERMVVVAAGAFDKASLMDILERGLAALPRGAGRPAADAPAFSPALTLRPKDFEQVCLELGWQGIPAGDERRYAMMLANFIIGGGASSRLFLRLREELGLAYSIYSGSYADTGAGLFTVSASVAPEVNTISCGCACSVRAMLSRAFSSVRSAATPSPCRDEGFPKVSRMTAQAASAACGSTFVVALWSRYITKYRAPVYSAKNRSISAWPGSIKTPVAAAFASV